MIKSNILTISKINQWLKWCQQRKNNGLQSFLTNVNENGILNKDFQYIYSLLDGVSSLSNIDKITQNNENKFFNYKHDMYISQYLFNNLSESCKNEIFNVISNGMKHYQLCFNDSLLFLLYLIDENKFTHIKSNYK